MTRLQLTYALSFDPSEIVHSTLKRLSVSPVPSFNSLCKLWIVLTPCNAICLENPTVAQLFTKFAAVCRTRRFITVSTRANLICCFFKINFNNIVLRMTKLSKWSRIFTILDYNSIRIFYFFHAYYTPTFFHLPSFHYPKIFYKKYKL
jgi:hypothetical protein